MTFPPIRKDFEGLMTDTRDRLAIVERRIGALPDRLREGGQQVTNWNDAKAVGFYWGIDATNQPVPIGGPVAWWSGIIQSFNGGARILQTLSRPDAPGYPTYSRFYTSSSGTWSEWASSEGPGGYSERVATNITNVTSTYTQITPISVTVTLARATKLRLSAGFTTYSTVSADVVGAQIRDGASSVFDIARAANSSPSIVGTTNTHNVEQIVTAAAGTHTYTLWVVRGAGSGSITIHISTVAKAWLRAEYVEG